MEDQKWEAWGKTWEFSKNQLPEYRLSGTCKGCGCVTYPHLICKPEDRDRECKCAVYFYGELTGRICGFTESELEDLKDNEEPIGTYLGKRDAAGILSGGLTEEDLPLSYRSQD